MKPSFLALGLLTCLSSLSFAAEPPQATSANPNVCDPADVSQCWFRCITSSENMSDFSGIEVYVSPAKEGKSQYLIQESRDWNINKVKPVATGEMVRTDSASEVQWAIGKRAQLSVKVLGIPTNQNGWIMSGPLTMKGFLGHKKTHHMICSYENRYWIESYEFKFDERFPKDFYSNFYRD